MQTLVIQVPSLGVFFPLRLDSSIIAYRATVSKDGSEVVVDLKEPTTADLALTPGALLESIVSKGYKLARIGVLTEPLNEFVPQDGRTLEPLKIVKTGTKWVMLASSEATLLEFLKAVRLEGTTRMGASLARATA